MRRARWAVLAALLLPALAGAEPGARFKEGNDLFRAGDYPKAIEAYREVAAAGAESASLYWNWAQAAQARGQTGEALWALLRARDVEPGDRALGREIERLREAANLDAAEIAPVPLAAIQRVSRRFHLDLVALLLLAGSVMLHAITRRTLAPGRLSVAADITLGLGVLIAAAPLVGGFAQPTAVVIQAAAPLLDAASPTAATTGTLREGEVVLVLASSEGYVRVEDSSGARGWASTEAARPLDRPR